VEEEEEVGVGREGGGGTEVGVVEEEEAKEQVGGLEEKAVEGGRGAKAGVCEERGAEAGVGEERGVEGKGERGGEEVGDVREVLVEEGGGGGETTVGSWARAACCWGRLPGE
jgi:hypothetical protein